MELFEEYNDMAAGNAPGFEDFICEAFSYCHKRLS
jgi:hypothetical protein